MSTATQSWLITVTDDSGSEEFVEAYTSEAEVRDALSNFESLPEGYTVTCDPPLAKQVRITNPPTANQLAFIETLISELATPIAYDPEMSSERRALMNKQEASDLITKLIALPKKPPMASPNQINYIISLLAQREFATAEDVQQRIEDGVLPKAEASTIIDTLLHAPRREKAGDVKVLGFEIPEGRYAVPAEGDGHLIFVIVDHWDGIKQQLSDNTVDFGSFNTKRVIAEKIAADPKAAAIAYGKHLGVCGCCGRTLTNEESRAYGIGPICRGMRGW